jgi:hypothetical protein
MPHELPIPLFLADDTNNGCQLTISTITTTATTTNTIATITDDNYENICQYTTTSHTRRPAICPSQNVTSTKLILAMNNVQLKCGARSKKLPGRWRHRWKDHPKTVFQEICSKEVNQIKHALNTVQWQDPK